MTPCTHQLNNLAPARAIPPALTLARDLDRPLRRAVGEWLREEATIPPIWQDTADQAHSHRPDLELLSSLEARVDQPNLEGAIRAWLEEPA